MRQPHTHMHTNDADEKNIGTMSSLPLMLMMLQHDSLGCFWQFVDFYSRLKLFFFNFQKEVTRPKYVMQDLQWMPGNVQKLLPRHLLLHLTHEWLESWIKRRRNQSKRARRKDQAKKGKERQGKGKAREEKAGKGRKRREEKKEGVDNGLQNDSLGCFWPAFDLRPQKDKSRKKKLAVAHKQ